jgi:F-type H+-transporting ATPase subunit gamma
VIAMANAKEIQNRIRSIQDTMKITKAMYMMSSMKLRKAKQQLADTEPYFYGLQKQIASILYHFPDMEHAYFDNRNSDRHELKKKKAFIVMTGDKGMAGAYNHNVIKKAQQLCEDISGSELFVVGELGRQYFLSQHYPVYEGFQYTATNPTVHRARVITELIVNLYRQNEIDEIYVVYTKLVNSMKEDVEVQQLLPLKTHQFLKNELLEEARKNSTNMTEKQIRAQADVDDAKKEGKFSNDGDFYIYPSPRRVLKKVVYNYVTGFIYGALVEASASEENARMLAMQSATNNAEEMLRELSIQYNRVRQAAITQEITEVIGGAKALKKKKKRVR